MFWFDKRSFVSTAAYFEKYSRTVSSHSLLFFLGNKMPLFSLHFQKQFLEKA